MLNKSIPNGWKKVQFGDVVNKVNDKVPNREEWTFERFIGGRHFDEGEIRITRSAPIKGNEEVIGSAFHMRFKPGQVLYVTRNPRLRKGGMVDFEGVCSNVSFVMEADETQLLQSLLPFIIQTEDFVRHTCNNAHGSTNPFLNWKDITKYEILLPPLEEQKRISEVLWNIETQLSKSWDYNNLLCLFINKIRNYYFEELILKKESQEYSLRDLIKIKHGFAFKGEFFTEIPNKNFLLTPVNFKIGGGFSSKSMKYYLGDFPPEYILKKDDLIVVMTDLSVKADILGYPAKIPDTLNNNYLHNQRIGKISINSENKLDKDFLYWVLTNRKYREHIIRTAAGTTVHHTSPDKILDFKLFLPNLFVQKTIVKNMEKMQRVKEEIVTYFEHLKNLRNKLSNELLKGDLRLK